MKRCSSIMSVLLTLALPVAATCADAPKAQDKPEPSSVESVQKSMSKSRMMSGMGAAGASGLTTSGKVAETMSGGGYTYAKLEKDGKSTWVAFPTTETRVGEALFFRGCMEMNNFESKSLNRKFEKILFCSAPEVTGKGAAAKLTPAAGKKSPGSAGAASAAGKKIKVEKAAGANAHSVAEIFAKRGQLNGKQVVVRGQVVKVSSGIMKRNWIHLQDGTGTEKQKNHDLVVTSQSLPEVGEVVTVSGILAKDKDFGGGYKYNAIIENGSIKK
jgi:hypothetical protein